MELRQTLVGHPPARGSSFSSGGGEETIKARTKIVEGEVGRDRRKGGRGCGRILVVPHDVYLRLPDPSLQEAISPKGPKSGEGVGALIVTATNAIPRELPARREDRPQRFGQGSMLRDPAETARRRTEPDHRQIIANHTGRARASRKDGGQQEREALTARVRLPKHGVVAGRKRKYKGGTGERGLPSGGEPPENGPAPSDLGPSPEPPSASIERQFERPQAVVGVGSKGPRDGELPARRQGSARAEHGAEVPTMPAPAVVPLGSGVVGGDHPRGGEPTAVGGEPAGVCRRGPKDEQRI